MPGRVDTVRYTVASFARRPSVEAARFPAAAINFALVIDATGSMGGDKLDNATAAALGVARRLGPSDMLSVVSFADDGIVHIEAQTPVGEAMSGNRAAIGPEYARHHQFKRRLD